MNSQTVTGGIIPTTDTSFSLGSSTNFFDIGHFNRVVLDPITTGNYWTTDIVTGNHYGFGYLATPSSPFTELYTLNNTGTPSAATDLIPKAYADANYAGGGASLPVDDTTSLVQDPVDNTKQVRIDAGNVPTSTTAVLSVYKNNGFISPLYLKGDGSDNSLFYFNDGSDLNGGYVGYGGVANKVVFHNNTSVEQLNMYVGS